MNSVSVALRKNVYFVCVLHGTEGSDPCLVAAPVHVMPADQRPEELGRLVKHALTQTTHHYPYPTNSEEWRKIGEPLLKAASVKTWSAFAKLASDLRVDQRNDRFNVLPCIREGKGAFAPVPERQREFTNPSDEELGTFIAAELAFALERDGTG